MERKSIKPMTPFDNMVTPPSLYTLKLLLPYTPSSNQRSIAIYIKFMEMQYTMDHFYGFSSSNGAQIHGQNSAPLGIFEDLKPYMAKEEAEMMEQMEMMMNMMDMVQGMPTADGNANTSGGFNPMDMMMGMLNPEQQDMFQSYSNMFDNQDDSEKGDHNYEHESMDESPRNEKY